MRQRRTPAAHAHLRSRIGAVAAAGIAASLGLASPSAASVAAPPVCTATVIERALLDAGKLTPEDVEGGEVVNLIRCGDVTDDGDSDALFTLASGGTAGDIRFGVLRGGPDGSAADLALFKPAYKVGVARRNRRSFDVLQPHYGAGDPNCCPRSFRVRRYTWTGSRFKAGKAKKRQTAPARFYRQ